MKLPEITIRLPEWVEDFLGEGPEVFSGDAERMGLVIELARRNVRHLTGGPFGAAVFDAAGRLVAAGVNTVWSANCSVFHAEIMALALAQKVLGRYDIGDNGRLAYDLFATTDPCAMCLGAIPWSGVRRLVCGARDEDARALGFDEGAKPDDWVQALQLRGIAVERDLRRDEAVTVLREYLAAGGPIYNSGRVKNLKDMEKF